jgi:hypothetical protein
LHEGDRPAHRVLEVRLAFDEVFERGRGRVLEVRHEHVRAAVQGVDDHLAVDRTGDLDAPVAEIGRSLGDLPRRSADLARLVEEARTFTGVEAGLDALTSREELPASRAKMALEISDESQGLRRQDALGSGDRRTQHGDSGSTGSEEDLRGIHARTLPRIPREGGRPPGGGGGAERAGLSQVKKVSPTATRARARRGSPSGLSGSRSPGQHAFRSGS